MKQEDRQLLLIDLCARLPYDIVVHCTDRDTDYKCLLTTDILHEIQNGHEYYDYKPYLRPMSSMTEDERCKARDKFFADSDNYNIDDIGEILADTYQPYASVYTLSFLRLTGYIDWLNAHHFDYRGLIEKGLALEAPKRMYKFE